MTIGERIRKVRGPISQKEFARRIGATQSAVQTWESHKSIPAADVLENILGAFPGWNGHWLASGKGDERIGGVKHQPQTEDGEGLYGRTKHHKYGDNQVAVTLYEPEAEKSEDFKLMDVAPAPDRVFISEVDLALLRALHFCGDEYRKRIYTAISIRARNVLEERKLEAEEKLKAQKDTEILSTAAVE